MAKRLLWALILLWPDLDEKLSYGRKRDFLKMQMGMGEAKQKVRTWSLRNSLFSCLLLNGRIEK